MSTSSAEVRHKLVGCRFSGVDAATLGIAAGLSVALRANGFPLWWIVPAAVLHFFLFCNVFRIRRRLEITWAVIFMLNVTGWFLTGRDEGFYALLSQLPVTIAVIAWEMRSQAYHGIFAERLNPQLEQYLAARMRRPVP